MLESNMDPGRTSVSMLSANHDRRRRPTEHRILGDPLLEGPHLVVWWSISLVFAAELGRFG
jgi:hypothetical protein